MLQVKITKKLPDFTLDVAFTMKNSILVLFGPSGCGKTTTLRCIAGLAKPDQGTIILKNQLLFSADRKVFLPPRKRKVGYMFQDYALFPHYNVQKNILYGAEQNDNGQVNCANLMKTFRISHLAERYPALLSGGEKQRVALARALMAEPEVLLLDEPFSALGDDMRAELQQELITIRKLWDIPLIIVTHNLKEAELLGDEIIFMDKGSIIDKTACGTDNRSSVLDSRNNIRLCDIIT